jgi:hypothetical protein
MDALAIRITNQLDETTNENVRLREEVRRLRALAWWPHDHEHRHTGMRRQHSHRHFHKYEGGDYDFNVEAHPVTHRDHDHAI